MGILLFRMSGVLVEWSPGGGSDDGCKGIGEERPQLTVLEREPVSDWTGSDLLRCRFYQQATLFLARPSLVRFGRTNQDSQRKKNKNGCSETPYDRASANSFCAVCRVGITER